MKNSIIEQLYFNKLNLGEQVKLSDEYNKISDEADEYFNRLSCSLNSEQKAIFEKYVELQMEVCAEGEFLHFKEGLKFGFRLATECLK